MIYLVTLVVLFGCSGLACYGSYFAGLEHGMAIGTETSWRQCDACWGAKLVGRGLGRWHTDSAGKRIFIWKDSRES